MNPKIEKLQTLVTTQHSEKADAIVWLQGNMYDRGTKVLELYRGGYAPYIVVTGNNVRVVDDDSVGVDDIVVWLKKHGVSQEAIILDKQSLNTYNQAVQVMALAKERDWSAILLVGSTHHQFRAFLTFLRQARVQKWGGLIINQPVAIAWDVKPSGRRKTTREAFQDELAKVQEYAGRLASVEEGLLYLQKLDL